MEPPATGDDLLERARACYARRAWREAYDLLTARGTESPLPAAELEALATAAFLVAEDRASDEAWARAHRQHLQVDNRPAAVRCAFWLTFRLLNAGDLPGASGWIARVERLVDDVPGDSPEHGYLAYLTGLLAVFSGDLPTAEVHLGRAARLADLHREADLATLARLALGRVLIFRGAVSRGVRLVDEAMVAVVAGEASPIVVGDSYCSAIDACHDVFDVGRGQAWTAAFTRWCEAQPDLVPYAGLCLVHRSELLQLKGAWVEAMAQAGRARVRLSTPVVQPALGAALYQQGELHRLRGRFTEAERCYRQASSHGKDPQPGLALLRLACGEAGAAAQGIRRALAETDDPVSRPSLLAAHVEVMLAVGDVAAARASCAELAEVAGALGSRMLAAVAGRAAGAVALAEGDARRALAPLHRAAAEFRRLEAAYDVARTSLLVAQARGALGDDDGARLELDASRATLRALGAMPDLRASNARQGGPDATGDRVLTAREIQVLRLVARGSTNRSIGAELGVSERTVDRHVSNILAKLGVSSRAAATARAYESGLL